VGAAQKKARRRRATIVFLDETGFRLQPLNRRTWAVRGCTPEQRSWDRHDRLSVIGVVTLSPGRMRVGSYFDVQRENVRAPDVVDFLRRLRTKLRRPLIVVWDRWNAHRSAATRIAERGWKNIDFEFLPAYAPQLNPVEAMWSHAKYSDLANYVPDDADQLQAAVTESLQDQSRNQRLKRSYFKTAQLKS
jgi:transposase